MKQGMSNSEACRMVGIDRRTGTRWRYGRSVTDRTGRTRTYPSINRPTHPVSVRYLSESERVAIADGLIRGRSLRDVAEELGRAPSTVSREIRRNRDDRTGRYQPFGAQRRAAARRLRPKPRKLARDSDLREFVRVHLEQHWSPEQISMALSGLFPDRPDMRVGHEAIYQSIFAQDRGRLHQLPGGLLRSGRSRRKPRRRAGERRSRFIEPMVMISGRPAEVADRIVPGHWEGDLITGAANRSAIGTLVERTSRYLMLLHLPDGHGAEDVRDALVDAVSVLPPHVRRSLTPDQGIEMARHDEFTRATKIPVYFCERASPWQRGSNENTNGLLRQYFPKGTDLTVHTAERLAQVAAELNARPRKTLGWETPSSHLDRLIASTS
jgi:IS30 family transposase